MYLCHVLLATINLSWRKLEKNPGDSRSGGREVIGARRCRRLRSRKIVVPKKLVLRRAKHLSGAGWRTFILIPSDAPTPETKNSKTLQGQTSDPWFPRLPADVAAREGRGTGSGDDN
jgi:hypothetical protein